MAVSQNYMEIFKWQGALGGLQLVLLLRAELTLKLQHVAQGLTRQLLSVSNGGDCLASLGVYSVAELPSVGRKFSLYLVNISLLNIWLLPPAPPLCTSEKNVAYSSR